VDPSLIPASSDAATDSCCVSKRTADCLLLEALNATYRDRASTPNCCATASVEPKLVAKLMAEMSLIRLQTEQFRVRAQPDAAATVDPVKRDLRADEGTKGVGDITNIKKWQGPDVFGLADRLRHPR
jgi:hypothetical protein